MPSIFVLDDEPLILDVISRALRPLGYVVTTCSTAIGAWALICAMQPDLIMLDVVLPHTSGWTLCAELAAAPATAAIPVLIITGGIAADARAKAVRVGAAGVLGKPFSLHELRAQVHALVPARRHAA